MNYVWPVIFSVLLGIVIGAVAAYKVPKVLVGKANTYLVVGIVILSLPFTIYFSIEQSPLTLLFYFIPAFGAVYVFIGSTIVSQQEEEKYTNHYTTLRDFKEKESLLKAEMSLDDLLEEKARRDAAKEYKSHVTRLSDEDLNKRISELRRDNRS